MRPPGPIRWVNNEWGYQSIYLGREQKLKRDYVKIWYNNGERRAIDTALTVAKAKQRIKHYQTIARQSEPEPDAYGVIWHHDKKEVK